MYYLFNYVLFFNTQITWYFQHQMSIQIMEFDLPISYYRTSENSQIGSFTNIPDICFTFCAKYVKLTFYISFAANGSQC